MIRDFTENPTTDATTNLNHPYFGPNVTYRRTEDSLWGPKRDPLYIVIPVTILYSLIFITGLIGNVSTCVVIARNRGMHTATNYYLFSLAVSDLLLLVSGLPQEVYSLWSKYPYVFGEVFCVVQGFTSETSTNATVLTITAFTVERYVAICHPFLSATVSKLSRAVKFIFAVWIVSLISAVPQAMQFGLVYETNRKGEKISEEYKICAIKNHFSYSFEISAVVFFFAPMSVITVLYVLIGVNLHRAGDPQRNSSGQGHRGSNKGPSKSTRRVVRMLVVVVVAFFICWAPFQAQRLFALHGDRGRNTSPAMVLLYQIITYLSGLLYFLSTTVNPFLYNIMSHKFRDAFKTTLSRCLSGRGELVRSELGGSSEGRPRFNYSVLSHSHSDSSGDGDGNNMAWKTGLRAWPSQVDEGAPHSSFQIPFLYESNSKGVSSDSMHVPSRSARAGTGPTHSLSSGHSSYVEQLDFQKRPLVVSFRRKPGVTEPPSLDLPSSSPEKRELLEVPRNPGGEKRAVVRSYLPRSPNRRRQETDKGARRAGAATAASGQQRVPRIEDIEIFQESQLRITIRRKEDFSCPDYSPPGGKADLPIVKKSYTVPCLVMN